MLLEVIIQGTRTIKLYNSEVYLVIYQRLTHNVQGISFLSLAYQPTFQEWPREDDSRDQDPVFVLQHLRLHIPRKDVLESGMKTYVIHQISVNQQYLKII